jgi:hypothetical protein
MLDVPVAAIAIGALENVFTACDRFCVGSAHLGRRKKSNGEEHSSE